MYCTILSCYYHCICWQYTLEHNHCQVKHLTWSSWRITEHNSQIYIRNARTCTILILPWGSNWASLSFSCDQNNRGSLDAYVTCMSAIRAWRQTGVKQHMARKDCECICFAFTHLRVVSKNPNTEPHGRQRHYTGQYRSGTTFIYLCNNCNTQSLWCIVIRNRCLYHSLSKHKLIVMDSVYWFGQIKRLWGVT